MNTDILKGTATDLGGMVKETLGDATGDRSLQASGLADQVGGTVQKTYGQARDVVEDVVDDKIRPLIDYVRQFSKERPFTAAAFAGVLGIAVIHALRGK